MEVKGWLSGEIIRKIKVDICRVLWQMLRNASLFIGSLASLKIHFTVPT